MKIKMKILIIETNDEDLIRILEFMLNKKLQLRYKKAEEDYKEGKIKNLKHAMKELGII